MNQNTALAIIGAAFCVMLGLACLATHSAEPLWGMVLVIWVFLAL